MSNLNREKELLAEMASLAGRINRHKREQKEKERKLLDDVARLSGRINRHKQILEQNSQMENRGMKRVREDEMLQDKGTVLWQFH